MFQLKRRLENLRMQPTESITSSHESSGLAEDEEMEVNLNAGCNGKPESGNRQVKVCFGRRWTHNEELCVASCGVILGRATFLGSEAPNGVRVSHSFDTFFSSNSQV
jgi:hypothetical protein